MQPSTNTASQGGLLFKAAIITAFVAVTRFFIKDWLAPLGVPTIVGSILASITLVLIIAMVSRIPTVGERLCSTAAQE
jgi:hypothetical protein